jgi:GTP 3',8-cyclase
MIFARLRRPQSGHGWVKRCHNDGLILDRFHRPLRSLRVSVTDRCNLRCQYCMPEPDYAWLPRQSILDFEEIAVLVDAFTPLGVDRLRITGGEPLLRRDLPRLIALLADRPAIRDLALTTNGVLLAAQAKALRDAGLHRITVSLDTLRRDRFQAIARFDELPAVLAGIDAAAAAGFGSLKIDSVIIRGRNDDELSALLEFGRRMGAEVRFIEYMDVGGATKWSREAVVPRREMLEQLSRVYGEIAAEPGRDSAPAERFRLPDGTTFGIIASTTEPFCAACDRSRLTADGLWLLCLYARGGLDLRRPLREGATSEELGRLISTVWSMRADRGAEERLESPARDALIPVAALKRDAHLEMHTRGG